MHFTALISFLSLSVVVAALPADIPRESSLLARVNAVSGAFDPKRDHLENQTYVAPNSSLIGQKVSVIYNNNGVALYAVADNYLEGFTWNKVFAAPNGSPADSKKTITYSEGTALKSGAETTVKMGITAEYQGVGLEFGQEKKTFTEVEKSTVKTVSDEITLAKGETTFYYQRQYNYRTHVWFSYQQGNEMAAVFGVWGQPYDDEPESIFVRGDSKAVLDVNFTSEVLSQDHAILVAPLMGTVTLEDLKTYQPPAQYNLSSLKTARSYGEIPSNGQGSLINYIQSLR